jgi:hypothetical protein
VTFADNVLSVAILAGALWLLHRSIRKSRGGCHGCASGACRPAAREAPALVSLGRGGAPGGPARPDGRGGLA